MKKEQSKKVAEMVNALGIKVIDAIRFEMERWTRETGKLPAPLR